MGRMGAQNSNGFDGRHDKSSGPSVALFVTCLVDLYRPSVAFSALSLLGRAGCAVAVPEVQTCCGQPAFNSGDRKTTEAIVRRFLPEFMKYDYVVLPSGSCAGMFRKHLPDLFEDDEVMAEQARSLAAKSYELTSFLVDVMGFDEVQSGFRGRVTYHDSCAGLRELTVKAQPRRLMASVPGLKLVEMADCEECCGFGGTFCVKYPEISTRMVDNKIGNIERSGAETILAGDLGCLLSIAGRLKRQGSPIKVRHVVEVLAEPATRPAIGEKD